MKHISEATDGLKNSGLTKSAVQSLNHVERIAQEALGEGPLRNPLSAKLDPARIKPLKSESVSEASGLSSPSGKSRR